MVVEVSGFLADSCYISLMTKRFYNLLNLLLAMMLVAGLIQAILRCIIGADLFRQESFLNLFLAHNIVSLFMSVLLMQYFWFKHYWSVFFVTFALTLVTLIHSSTIYLGFLTLKPQPLYLPTLVLHLGLNVIYSCTLIFSTTGKRKWLKTAGIILLIICIPTAASVIWFLVNPLAQTAILIEKFTPWLLLFASFVPIFFILHFREESSQIENDLPPKDLTSSFSFLQWSAVFVGIVLLAFSIKVSSDVYWSSHWSKQNFEQTKELARRFESRVFVGSKGDTLYYRLLKPLKFDTAKKYPLLISLPYGGQPGTDKIRQLEGAAAAGLLSTKENMEKYPSFIFIPNCPAGSGWGGIPGYPSVDSLVFEAIAAISKEKGIDAKRRYVTGISRGGYGTWNFIISRPDLFAAAIPVCGGGDPTYAAAAKDVAIWAFHGENDKNVPVSGSRNIIAAIRKAGGHPKYTEFANEGHNIWDQTSRTPGLWDWLFAQHQQ